MAILQRMMIALLSVAMLAAGAVNAASTTNFSDQWWNEDESGWGVSVLQQADVLFITLGVYGADNKPTWFTGAAFIQSGAAPGHTLFTGDLYQTNGPYHGGSFNTLSVTYVTVGTLTFDAATANDATLTYSVDGRSVVKNVTRQLWRYENLSGKYSGSWINDYDSCGPNKHDVSIVIDIVHNADNTIELSFSDREGDREGWLFGLHGTYSQSGHIGKIVGSVDYPGTGYFTFSEIEKSTAGFTGRIDAVTRYHSGNVWHTCVTTNGRIAVARR